MISSFFITSACIGPPIASAFTVLSLAGSLRGAEPEARGAGTCDDHGARGAGGAPLHQLPGRLRGALPGHRRHAPQAGEGQRQQVPVLRGG